MANIQRTSQQWQEIIEQHAPSGLQVATFCKQQQITPSSFYAWRKRLANQPSLPSITSKPIISESAQNDWHSISPEPNVAALPWDIELSLPNGVVLRMMNT
jgi:hypothetical protein